MLHTQHLDPDRYEQSCEVHITFDVLVSGNHSVCLSKQRRLENDIIVGVPAQLEFSRQAHFGSAFTQESEQRIDVGFGYTVLVRDPRSRQDFSEFVEKWAARDERESP